MANARTVPWNSWEEWTQVRSWLFAVSAVDNIVGLRRVRVYLSMQIVCFRPAHCDSCASGCCMASEGAAATGHRHHGVHPRNDAARSSPPGKDWRWRDANLGQHAQDPVLLGHHQVLHPVPASMGAPAKVPRLTPA
jgi:hypothetical protein